MSGALMGHLGASWAGRGPSRPLGGELGSHCLSQAPVSCFFFFYCSALFGSLGWPAPCLGSDHSAPRPPLCPVSLASVPLGLLPRLTLPIPGLELAGEITWRWPPRVR